MVWQAHLISALSAQAGIQVLRADVRQHCRSRFRARAAERQLRPAARARWGVSYMQRMPAQCHLQNRGTGTSQIESKRTAVVQFTSLTVCLVFAANVCYLKWTTLHTISAPRMFEVGCWIDTQVSESWCNHRLEQHANTQSMSGCSPPKPWASAAAHLVTVSRKGCAARQSTWGVLPQT